MKKKILLGLVTVLVVSSGVAAMSAYEAHVINVTAKIENALSVSTNLIEFGTVFPQEILYRDFCIHLSQSFIDEDRVDDVEYVIKQKPKVKVDPYAIIIVEEDGFEGPAHEYCLNYIPEGEVDLDDIYYVHCYPNLSPYLSKHKAADDNYGPGDVEPYDVEVDAPNPNWATQHAEGYLSKKIGDIMDHWEVDLVVPCFEGMCDQDYDPAIYGLQLDPLLEHQIFGTDLWIEVIFISEDCPGC